MHSNLQDRYSIVGVGETDYSRGSGRSTRALATEAILNAMGRAGLTPKDVDGMLSYHGGDSTTSSALAYDMGIRLNFYMDCSGGGSSKRGAGRAGHRRDRGGHVRDGRYLPLHERLLAGPHRRHPRQGIRAGIVRRLLRRPYGLASALQSFAFTFTRHYDGVRSHRRRPRPIKVATATTRATIPRP